MDELPHYLVNYDQGPLQVDEVEISFKSNGIIKNQISIKDM